jgi:DNA primase catalytic core
LTGFWRFKPMARLSDETIDRIKRETDFLRLVASQGYQVKKHGSDDYVMPCPFHDDKTPSLVISPDTNLFNCFGCGAAGSVIDWVMKTQNLGFRDAADLLRKDFPLAASGQQATPKPEAKAQPDRTKHQDLLQRVTEFYHNTLKQNPDVQAYLEKRGLLNAELIDAFKLGFSNRSLHTKLASADTRTGKDQRAELVEVGLFHKTGHELFNGCLVVPVIDENGLVLDMYGRKISTKLRKSSPRHLYLPGSHAGVWNAQALAVGSEVILCESLIDAMTFWVSGFRNVTASYGTGGFTSDHLVAFKQAGVQRVLIAYDRDDAGDTAAEKLAGQLMDEGLEVFRVVFPQGLDVNEYARQSDSAHGSLGQVLRQAQWMGNGKAPERQLALSVDGLMVDGETGEVIGRDELAEAVEPVAPAPVEAVEPVAVSDLAADEHEGELIITLGDLIYRVRGLDRNAHAEQLKINLLARRGEHFHVDNLDLYAARARFSFIKQASLELSLDEARLKADLGKLLVFLESRQAKVAQEKLDEQQGHIGQVALNDLERAEAVKLLKDPSLLSRILADLEFCGVIGENTNKLVSYLATVSRKLDKPLAVMIQSSSAAGKSSLMDAVLNMIPAEERIQFSAMTGQSLFYMGETNLKNKILAISEEEGADQASYALKLLQSEGEVSIASTGKNATTGQLETQQYRVEGPVMLFMTTTAIDIDEELMNRCLVLSVNESREQTEAIHRMQRQRQTIEGLLADQDKKARVTLHQNAQRLLRPLLVANPYAEKLTFLSDKTRTRRDHMKYLTLIQTVTLLHQYQRPIKRIEHHGKLLEYIEVTPADIEIANQLAHEVLGRSLDELPPQTRKMLNQLKTMVAEGCKAGDLKQADYRFSRRDLLNNLGWSYDQVRVHLDRLIKLEYVLTHKGGRGQSFIYELLYDGQGHDHSHLNGLIDPLSLVEKQGKAASLGGKNKEVGGALGGHRVANGGGVVNAEMPVNKGVPTDLQEITEKTHIGAGKKPLSPRPAVAPAQG